MSRFECIKGSGRRALAAALVCLACCAASQAAVGPMDFLFTSTGAIPAADRTDRQQVWKVSELSALRLVPRESGSAPNQHPVKLNPDWLRSMFDSLEVATDPKNTAALFGADEARELAPAVAKALATATSGEDLIVLSTARRQGDYISPPKSITARLFMQDGALQVIVPEARRDAANEYRVSRIVPVLAFGSRGNASGTALRSGQGASKRGDWVAFAATGAPTEVPSPVPRPPAAIVAPAIAPPAAAVPAPAPPAAAPAPRTRDAAFFAEQEQRLQALKRLREQNLITEDEYQQKRREILQSL